MLAAQLTSSLQNGHHDGTSTECSKHMHVKYVYHVVVLICVPNSSLGGGSGMIGWHRCNVRGLRMGGWIRGGWIWRSWGAPIFIPEVP